MKLIETLKFGVFFFFFPFLLGYHWVNTVPPRAHLVALFAEVFISQIEGQILHKEKRRKRTNLANGAFHVAVVKWHGQDSLYVPEPSCSFQSHQDSCTGSIDLFLSPFFFPSYSKYQRTEKYLFLNKWPSVWKSTDICVYVAYLFFFPIRNMATLSLLNLLTFLNRNSEIWNADVLNTYLEISCLLVPILYLKKHSICSYLELLVKTLLLFHNL